MQSAQYQKEAEIRKTGDTNFVYRIDEHKLAALLKLNSSCNLQMADSNAIYPIIGAAAGLKCVAFDFMVFFILDLLNFLFFSQTFLSVLFFFFAKINS